MNSPSPLGGRQRLIDATLASIGERGYHRSSLRAIADIAGVTAGLVKHHFNSKDELMLEAYRHFGHSLAEAHLADVDKAGLDPVRRLQAYARSVFLFDPAREERMRIWAGFLELAVTDASAAAVQAATRARLVREITGCVAGVYAARGEQLSPDAAHKLAVGIHSAISGAWLECSLNPSIMSPAEALAIALDMIGGRIGVSFPQETAADP